MKQLILCKSGMHFLTKLKNKIAGQRRESGECLLEKSNMRIVLGRHSPRGDRQCFGLILIRRAQRLVLNRRFCGIRVKRKLFS